MKFARISALALVTALLPACGKNAGHRVAIRRGSPKGRITMANPNRIKLGKANDVLPIMDLIKSYSSDSRHTYFVYTADIDFLRTGKDGSLTQVADPTLRAIIALKEIKPTITAANGADLIKNSPVSNLLKITAQDDTGITLNGTKYKIVQKGPTFLHIETTETSDEIVYTYGSTDDSFVITHYEKYSSKTCASQAPGTLKTTYVIVPFKNGEQSFNLSIGLDQLLKANLTIPPEMNVQSKRFSLSAPVPASLYYAVLGELENNSLPNLSCK